MAESNEQRMAPGQELTLHPGDPIRGAELLEDQDRSEKPAAQPDPEPEDDEEYQEDEELKMEVAAEPVPHLRQPPEGVGAFAATQEPEFDTTPVDGRSSAPKSTGQHQPYLGAVTQDDPVPTGLHAYPDEGEEGTLTFVAVFEDITGAQSCSDDLDQRGLGVETMIVPRRGDGPEQGLRPGNVITGRGYGLSSENQSPPKDPGMGSGVAIGASLGATAGLLASTYVIPPWGPLVAAGSLVSTLAGAGIGSFLGGLTAYTTSEQQDGDDATLYAGQVRRGGALLLVRVPAEQADAVRGAIAIWDPLEIRVQ